MTEPVELADLYIDMWNETDPGRRRDIGARLWAADATYLDPVMQGSGRDGIDAMVAGVQARFPGFRFVRTGTVDAHNGRLRFSWALGPVGGPSVVEGTDFATLGGGRLKDVTGFFDKLPAAA